LKITRGGRLSGDLTEDVARFTSSSEHDAYIADEVVKINLAYVLMLKKGGVITAEEGRLLARALTGLEGKVGAVPPNMEDVHMVIEEAVTDEVGPEVGGKLHTGKSRNDQVATALRMRLRLFLLEILGELIEVEDALLQQSSANVEVVMPGFTHLQHAQPVTVAHHLLAHHDVFGRDLERLFSCYGRVNLSPMGSAALAGTGYPIDRHALARYLGFQGLVENTMDAVSSRDFALETVSLLSLLMVDISRLAEEVVIWSSLEYSYIELPDDHSSTSSIMPQKKNPVTAEILRARSGDVFGELASMLTIMKALPLAYNLDLQEVTPHMWRSCEAASLSLRVLADLVRKLKFNEVRLREVVRRDFSVATELADLMVREGKIPFRKSHKVVGEIVRELVSSSSSLSGEDPQRLSEMIFEKSGIRLDPVSVAKAVDPVSNVNIRRVTGGPSFDEVRRMIGQRVGALAVNRKRLAEMAAALDEGRSAMHSDLSGL
jgi:argininosuccinate lyase